MLTPHVVVLPTHSYLPETNQYDNSIISGFSYHEMFQILTNDQQKTYRVLTCNTCIIFLQGIRCVLAYWRKYQTIITHRYTQGFHCLTQIGFKLGCTTFKDPLTQFFGNWKSFLYHNDYQCQTNNKIQTKANVQYQNCNQLKDMKVKLQNYNLVIFFNSGQKCRQQV